MNCNEEVSEEDNEGKREREGGMERGREGAREVACRLETTVKTIGMGWEGERGKAEDRTRTWNIAVTLAISVEISPRGGARGWGVGLHICLRGQGATGEPT